MSRPTSPDRGCSWSHWVRTTTLVLLGIDRGLSLPTGVVDDKVQPEQFSTWHPPSQPCPSRSSAHRVIWAEGPPRTRGCAASWAAVGMALTVPHLPGGRAEEARVEFRRSRLCQLIRAKIASLAWARVANRWRWTSSIRPVGPEQVTGGHHRREGGFGPAAALEKPPGEQRPGAQPGDRHVDRAHPGVQGAVPIPVAGVGPIELDWPYGAALTTSACACQLRLKVEPVPAVEN